MDGGLFQNLDFTRFDDSRPLIVDSFAGGGGASLGISWALGYGPDIAINHSESAIAIHRANHPDCIHLSKNIWQVDPLDVVRNKKVGLLWASPDCRHFSLASGGKIKSPSVRDLVWAVVLWMKRARPRIVVIENVTTLRTYGPLVNGKPCSERAGSLYKKWIGEIKRLGYKVEERELSACDYGSPTIRRRLFIVCRCDGKPIRWPEPTHGHPESDGVRSGKLKPWRTAADIIDWSLPTPSIFATSDEIRQRYGLQARRPLAPDTLARIAKGIKRYVLENPTPYIVPGSDPGMWSADDCDRSTEVAFLLQANRGVVGHAVDKPLSTLTTKGCNQQLVVASLLNMRGTDRRDAPVTEPLRTITAGGSHAALVSALLVKYFGTGQAYDVRGPVHTETTKPRFALVTVKIKGETYAIADIGLRMLQPRERFAAQGFPESYEINEGVLPDGRRVQTTAEIQGRLCGNSVCPQVAEALVRANCPDLMAEDLCVQAQEAA